MTRQVIATCMASVLARIQGCGADKSMGSSDGADETMGTSGTGASSGTGSEVVPPPDGCTCQAGDGPVDCREEVGRVQCDEAVLCPTIAWTCPHDSQDFYGCSVAYEYDEAALDCALAALRDRTPGTVLAAGPTDDCGFEGCGTRAYIIAIRPDGIGVWERCERAPISEGAWSARRVELADPAYFEDCRNRPATADRFACMLQGLRDPEDVCTQ